MKQAFSSISRPSLMEAVKDREIIIPVTIERTEESVATAAAPACSSPVPPVRPESRSSGKAAPASGPIEVTLTREAPCVPWGITLLRCPDTPTAPIVIAKVTHFVSQADKSQMFFIVLQMLLIRKNPLITVLLFTTQTQVQGLSSASDARIQKGDILLSVNHQPVHGQTLQNISDQVHRDASNSITIGVSRPSSSLDRSRPMTPFSSPSSPIPGAVTQSQVQDLFRPLPRSPIPAQVRRYDPSSQADQERMIYDEEKQHEVRAIKTTPYRSQAVVSPKPKVIHDHVQGSYLQMQHYPDAPTHGSSPIPSYGHPQQHQQMNPSQQRMHETNYSAYVQQVDPHAASVGPIQLQYNSPIGLYSKENAINTLRQTHGGPTTGGPIRLLPDNVVMEGSERKLNLAASPTYRMVQAMEGPGRQHDPVQDRVYSPIPTYVPDESGHDPQQSASFKVRRLSLSLASFYTNAFSVLHLPHPCLLFSSLFSLLSFITFPPSCITVPAKLTPLSSQSLEALEDRTTARIRLVLVPEVLT